MADAYLEIENKRITKELKKKRFACAHCGNTWVELVGLVVWDKDGKDDVCLRIGMESENCQTCKFRPIECQRCSSKDVYEIKFSGEISEETPLTFKRIKKVSRG